MIIGRASPQDNAGEADPNMAATEEEAVCHTGRRPANPQRPTEARDARTQAEAACPPRRFAGAGTPGGEQDPGALQGARTSTLRIREAGTSAQGAEGQPRTARRGAAWR